MDEQLNAITTSANSIKQQVEAIRIMENLTAKKLVLFNIRMLSDDLLDAVDRLEQILGEEEK